jgi:hypothetical protein
MYTFPIINSSYPVTLTITDRFGCKRSVTKIVTIKLFCNADFIVEKYTFCKSDCNNLSKVSIKVLFKNLSTGGVCPISYDWDFGDPQSPGIETGLNAQYVSHTYSAVPCPNGGSFTVKLFMREGPTQMITCTKTLIIYIPPCEPTISQTICPDGKVVFTGNMKGEWNFPGASIVAYPPYSDYPDTAGLQSFVMVKYDASGDYLVEFTGKSSTGGRCKISKTVSIDFQCCVKNDRQKDKKVFDVAGKVYKMKAKFVQGQSIFSHRIKATTKFKKQQTIFGKTYYKGTNADSLKAGFEGAIFKANYECNCKVQTLLEYKNSVDARYNDNKAKFGYKVGEKYHSRKDSIKSTHLVSIGGRIEILNLYLGRDCNEFHWWRD